MHIPARYRVVVDNDWAGDPDGLVGLAHHLLAPANKVVAITGSLTNPMFGPPEGRAQAGIELARTLAGMLGARTVPLAAGRDAGFDGSLRRSPAAELIIEAATTTDELPLIVVCAGPLTNVADALAHSPGIASQFTLVWVGGSSTGSDEYNEYTDQAAADFVFSDPGLPITQFPLEAYQRLTLSVRELQHLLGGAGAVGRWLWERFETLPLPDSVTLGPLWCLGDSAPVVVTALEPLTSTFVTTQDDPKRILFSEVDTRMVLGDFAALLNLADFMTDRLGVIDSSGSHPKPFGIREGFTTAPAPGVDLHL